MYEYIDHNGSLIRSSSEEIIDMFMRIDEKSKEELDGWKKKLMQMGCTASHPDDGWVDRDKNCVKMEYPQFDLGVAPGDVIALGWPFKYRIIDVIRVDVYSYGKYVWFRPRDLSDGTSKRNKVCRSFACVFNNIKKWLSNE